MFVVSKKSVTGPGDKPVPRQPSRRIAAQSIAMAVLPDHRGRA